MTENQIKKAKEYAMSRTYPRFDSVFISNFVHREIEGAYLLGAKENGIQWHDLRKDPNDLPKSSPFHEVLDENGMKMYYDDVLKKWNMFTQNGIVQARPPIAWCEIPTFDKE